MSKTLRLPAALATLEEIAPLALAADWDNVGLLVEGPADLAISRCLLTVDLTEAVLHEAVAHSTQLIIAYHPPIFAPLKRLTRATREGRLVLGALQAGIAIYSPHTALDAAPGGVNDWLASAFPGAASTCLEPERSARADRWVQGSVSHEQGERLRARLPSGVLWVEGAADERFSLRCRQGDLAGVDTAIRDTLGVEASYDVFVLDRHASEQRGQGRLARLKDPISLEAAIGIIKRHLGLSHLRCAAAPSHRAGATIRSVALCPGAGGSVLSGVPADLYWTGEMRHHDLLAANEAGISVVLGEHSNTERGYLAILQERLTEAWPSVEIRRASKDADPVVIL